MIKMMIKLGMCGIILCNIFLIFMGCDEFQKEPSLESNFEGFYSGSYSVRVEDEYSMTYKDFFTKERYISAKERKEYVSQFSYTGILYENSYRDGILYDVAKAQKNENGLYIDPVCVYQEGVVCANGRFEQLEWFLIESGELYLIDPETYEITLICILAGKPTDFLVHGPLLFISTDSMLYRLYLPDLPKATVDVIYERETGDEKYENSYITVISSTDVMVAQRDTAIPNSGILGTGDGYVYRHIIVSDITKQVYHVVAENGLLSKGYLSEYLENRQRDVNEQGIGSEVLCDDPNYFEFWVE